MRRCGRRLHTIRVFIVAIAAVLAGLGVVAFTAAPSQAKTPPAYIVIDAQSGRVLAERAPDRRRHPASLTKMMTLYLTFEAIANREISLDDRIVMSRQAARMPRSKLGLRAGRTLTVREAVRASAVFSANDAAVALAEAISGTESAFARRMTRKAAALGMHDTVFRNASGLTAQGHLSTAADMAVLARRLWLDFPANYIVFGRQKVRIQGQVRRATNRLLSPRRGVDGIKTGYTSAAGFNLAAAAERGGRRVIVVAMGSDQRHHRDRAVSKLLDRGFAEIKRGLDIDRAPRPTPRPGLGLRPPIGLVASAPTYERTAAIAPASIPSRSMMAVAATPHDPSVAPAIAPRPATASARTAERLGAAASQRPARFREDRARHWAVQVGAYARHQLAARRLDAIEAMASPKLASASPQVETADASRRLFRARFAGLDERGARAACSWLERRKIDCALVPPSGWAAR